MTKDGGARNKRARDEAPPTTLNPETLEIRLLRGALEILDDGQPTAAPSEPLQRAALVVLAARAGQEVSADTIARACYHDFDSVLSDDSALQRNVRKRVGETLSVLRTTFRLPITTRPYKLAIDPDRVDLIRLDRQARDLLDEAGRRCGVRPG